MTILSRFIAEKIYVALLLSSGATISKRTEKQYSTNIYGSLKGIEFMFRVHHNKTGEFTKIDRQRTTSSDLLAVKTFFDCIRKCIISIPSKSYASLVTTEVDADLTCDLSSLSITDSNNSVKGK